MESKEVTSGSARGLLRELLATGDITAPESDLSADYAKDTAILASAVFSRLVARRFSTPDDIRIKPFVAWIASRFGLPPGGSACGIERLIRATLGERSQLAHISQEQIAGLQIFLIHVFIIKDEMTVTELEEIIDSAEPLAQLVIQQIEQYREENT